LIIHAFYGAPYPTASFSLAVLFFALLGLLVSSLDFSTSQFPGSYPAYLTAIRLTSPATPADIKGRSTMAAGEGFKQVKAHDFQSCNPVEAMVEKSLLWWASGYVRLATKKARRFRLRVFFLSKRWVRRKYTRKTRKVHEPDVTRGRKYILLHKMGSK